MALGGGMGWACKLAWTRTGAVAALGLAAAALTGCAAVGPQTMADGSRVVRLSDDADLLLALERTARSEDCLVANRFDRDSGYGSLFLHCRWGKMEISQQLDRLRYSCDGLRGQACDGLMLLLAPTSGPGFCTRGSSAAPRD